MPRLVVDLADRRPIFRLTDEAVAGLRSAVPAGWEVVVVDTPAEGTGDGARSASPAVLDAVRSAEVYFGFGVPSEVLAAGRGLRWVHSGAAGVGSALSAEMLARDDVVLTNSAGIHGPPVAETVIGCMLHFARGLDRAVRAQAEGRWRKEELDAADSPVRELSRSTVGIVGLGGIGREVAWRAAALGARVVGTRRSEAAGPDGVELLRGPEGTGRLLAESHYVVLTLPETDETRGMIDEAALDRMRREGVLINVGRGALVDEAALVAALERGGIRGAALDVFVREPLPPGDPLWSAPNTLITPHTSAYTHAFWDRELELITENLRRYAAGEPLRNVVDKRRGY